MQLTENEAGHSHEPQQEPPAKKRRGRPRTSGEDAIATKASAPVKRQARAGASPEEDAPAPKKAPGRRGRPRGSNNASENDVSNARLPVTQECGDEETDNQENEDPLAPKGATTTKGARASRSTTTATRGRGRGRAASIARPVQTDGEFEYTPTRAVPQQRISEVNETQQIDGPADEFVDESMLENGVRHASYAPSSIVKTARARLATLKSNRDISPSKRKSGAPIDQGGDPDLRRKIGEITKKHDALESKYRNLREIGVVEANTNMEKLRKQCENITTGTFLLHSRRESY